MASELRGAVLIKLEYLNKFCINNNNNNNNSCLRFVSAYISPMQTGYSLKANDTNSCVWFSSVLFSTVQGGIYAHMHSTPSLRLSLPNAAIETVPMFI